MLDNFDPQENFLTEGLHRYYVHHTQISFRNQMLPTVEPLRFWFIVFIRFCRLIAKGHRAM